jgi:hypothetical protein
VVIVAVLVVLWAAVLTPTLRRSLSRRHLLGDSVGTFRRQLRVLSRSGPTTIAAAHRLDSAAPSSLDDLVVPAQRPIAPLRPVAWRLIGDEMDSLPPPRAAYPSGNGYYPAPVDEPGALLWSASPTAGGSAGRVPQRRSLRRRQQLERRRQTILACLFVGLLAFSVGAAIAPVTFAGPDLADALLLVVYMWALYRVRQVTVGASRNLNLVRVEGGNDYEEERFMVSRSAAR